MSTYNGWTNYATWRINLEIFDGKEPGDLGCFTKGKEPELSDVAEYLSEHVDEILCGYDKGGPCGDSLTLDYARAFVSQVNWHEIAEHFIDEWKEEQEEEQEEEDQEQ